MITLFFIVSFLSSVAGSICGIGGGVIIKPVLDSTGMLPVSSVSFLSGCTVLSMSVISVLKRLQQSGNTIDIKTGTSLAIGAAAGGIIGKELFQYIRLIFENENQVGFVQALVLMIITIITFFYTINEKLINTHHIKNVLACIGIGVCLGVVSSFLGIGGGPINLMVLGYFFSMDMKTAAVNSLYVIMFSQLSSLFNILFENNIPSVSLGMLALMVVGGVTGGAIGNGINKKISDQQTQYLFRGLMITIILINIYNIIKFTR